MRHLLFAVLMVTAQPLWALCEGESLVDRFSDAERTEIAEAIAATPYPEGLFWTASKGQKELRLVGTMHLHDPRNSRIIARAAAMVETADLVLLELTRKEEAEVQAALINDPDRIFINSGPTLPDLLEEEVWQALAEAARARQIPPFMAAKFRPWYLSMSLAMPSCAMPDLMAGLRGVDYRIMDLAEARQIPMQALEPWDTLFQLMEKGTQEEQLDMLRLSIVPDDLQVAGMVAMLDGYFAGRIAEVWEVSRISVRYVPGLDPDQAELLFADMQSDLLDRRNRNWMPVIADATEIHDTIVVAVGAAHLPGEVGLLNLLEEDGWVVERAE